MAEKAKLEISLQTYWMCSAGRGNGQAYDTVCIRDASGFPYVPGRHLKGLLRDAVSRSGGWKDLNDGPFVASLLFGAPAEQVEADNAKSAATVRDEMPPGRYFGSLLNVTNAELSEGRRKAISDLKNEVHQEAVLFQKISATQMTEEGVAKTSSLRSYQMAVPLLLDAELSVDIAALDMTLADERPEVREVAANWFEILQKSAPFLRGVGALRNRGYGRAGFAFSEASV